MKGPPAHPAGREPVADPAILVAESGGFSPAAAARLRELGALALRDLDRGQLLDAIGETDVLWAGLRHSLDRELLERATRLRAIVTPTTGLDHVDLDTATELGIEVLSLRDRTNELREVRATAEHTIGLLLGLLRRVPSAVEHVRAGGWDRNRFWGSEIHGKTVGIVGYGRLGQIVGRYLTAFDASILASDPAVDAGAFEPPVQRAGLEELLARAEILTLHASLTDGSRGLIGRRELELMPRGSVLV
ncbi:MAG: NAD(P)-dependent oxidoreductase, partial [Solirubrobacterales bacterium]